MAEEVMDGGERAVAYRHPGGRLGLEAIPLFPIGFFNAHFLEGQVPTGLADDLHQVHRAAGACTQRADNLVSSLDMALRSSIRPWTFRPARAELLLDRESARILNANEMSVHGVT